MLTINNLTIGYKKLPLAGPITATLQQGKLTCLLGPNGAGKSTLLRTLVGFQPAMSGDIYLDAKPLQQLSVMERSRLVSIVLTNTVRNPGMTVYDVVALGRSPYTGFWGRLSEEDDRIIMESIRTVGVEDMVSRLLTTLSDGELQKVMISKAIAQQTPVIILDEPTAFLDYPSKVKMIQMLQQLTRTHNKAVLLSTHDLPQAIKMSDTLWLMDRQRGMTIGSPSLLSSNGTLSAYFEGVI